jgi:galactose mutarotase-like enzyme
LKIDRYSLNDGSSFSIAPDFGCNLFSWHVGGREVFYRPKGVPGERGKFYKGGNPVLFPSVGRTWDRSGDKPRPESYRIYGLEEEYRMPIHGILPDAVWKKTAEQVKESTIRVEYGCCIPREIRGRHYPFDIDFRLAYTIVPGNLSATAFFRNAGATPAPLAFGYHSYFALSDNSRQGVKIDLPCSQRLQLDPESLVPTGAVVPVDSTLMLEDGVQYDAVFSGMCGHRASLTDTGAARVIHIDFDDWIEALVVFSTAGASFVCIEPWTRGLGAYETLCRPGWEGAGTLNILQPGETRTIRVSYSVEPLS